MHTKKPSQQKRSGQTKGAPRGDKGRPLTGTATTSVAFHQLAIQSLGRAVLPCVLVTPAERTQLLRWVGARTSPQRLVVRSRVVLLASEGLSISGIASRLEVSPATVRLWCRRFHVQGVGALAHDAPGRGRREGMSPPVTMAVLRAMLDEGARGGVATTRALATRAGTSASTVWRVWKLHGVGPASSLSDIARAIEKVIDETRSGAK